jgi:hypothetical protein
MRFIACLPKDAKWLAGTCPACHCPMDEHGCRISEITRPNRATRRRLRIQLAVDVDCHGAPVGPIYPCPACAQKH